MPGWGNCYEQLEKKGCFEICQKEKGPIPALVEAGSEPSTTSHVDWQAMLHRTRRAGQELAVWPPVQAAVRKVCGLAS